MKMAGDRQSLCYRGKKRGLQKLNLKEKLSECMYVSFTLYFQIHLFDSLDFQACAAF